MIYQVRLLPEAEDDLFGLYRYIARKSSPSVAFGYTERIRSYLITFDRFPERGTVRKDLRPGLRIVGFERRVSIAFVVDRDQVTILRVLYGGRRFRRTE